MVTARIRTPTGHCVCKIEASTRYSAEQAVLVWLNNRKDKTKTYEVEYGT